MTQFLQFYIADVLIAVNPFKTMENLYSDDIISQYQRKSNCVLPPHVFGIGMLLI